MNSFFDELVTAPANLPIEVEDEDQALAAAIVEEVERAILWRAVVSQTRKITLDGVLPKRIQIEPTTAITLTKWTPTGAVVVDADTYDVVSRDPQGTRIEPVPWASWPEPERAIGSFTLTYECGWTVTNTENKVPASVQLMVERAVAFRKGSGLAGFTIGSLKIDVANSYSTDALPREIVGIGRAYAYRPGLFVGRP